MIHINNIKVFVRSRIIKAETMFLRKYIEHTVAWNTDWQIAHGNHA